MQPQKKLPVIIMCLFFVLSCSTQKSKEDISPIGKFYHNVTAKYNGYFNANVLLQESIDKLNEQHIDNYNKILDLYPYMSVDNIQAMSPDLDKAIEKVSVVIALHRVSHWTDDSYLLMGQSQFLKQDFESAEETLRFLGNEFNPDKTKRPGRSKKVKSKSEKKAEAKVKEEVKEDKEKERKKRNEEKKKELEKRNKEKKKAAKDKKKGKTTPKVEEKKVEIKPIQQDTTIKKEAEEKPKSDPDNYFLKHRPSWQVGQLWLARTFIERKNYDDATRIMRELENNPKLFKDVNRDLAKVEAYYQLKQKNYSSAIPKLEKAISLSKDKKDKARMTFILAQLHQQANQTDAAYVAFQRVLKYRPDYEMAFNTKLNMAMSSWVNGKTSADDAIKSLSKMSKDVKNKEYLDQIYFTIANIHLKNNRKAEAIENFKLSLVQQTNNVAQKTETYYALATLFYQGEDYVSAKSYYDSTLNIMTKNDERFADVTKYSTGLTDIAINSKIITLQDSLLAISKLSEKEKKDFAKKIKEIRDKEAEIQAKKAALANAVVPGSRPNTAPGGLTDPRTGEKLNPGGNKSKPSTFFAYNENSIKKGKQTFDRKWGDRQLEDNWRRSNKKETNIKIDENEGVASNNGVSDSDLATILKDVPNTPEKIELANKQIEAALFKLGTLYRDRIDNNKKCAETLEKLLTRYPETTNELDAWYYLYLAYTDLNNKAKAQEYFDKIIKKYPETTYARVLKDPNYLESTKEEERKLMRYYDSAYADFQKGAYKAATEKISKSSQMFGVDNELKAKFALLNAMCLGSIQGKEGYITALKDVISKHPNTPEQKRAKEMLRLLDANANAGDEVGLEKAANNEAPKSAFKPDDNKLHYIIVVLSSKSLRLEDAKVAVSDYNREYHKLDDLKISNIALNGDQSVIVIRKFKDKATAMKYYEGVEKNQKDFINKKSVPYEMFAVSQDNYRELLRLKTTDEYREFFAENYLNK